MEYAFIGFLIPAKDNNDANNIICQVCNTVYDSNCCDLRGAYNIAGCPVLSDVGEFGTDLENFVKKYTRTEN